MPTRPANNRLLLWLPLTLVLAGLPQAGCKTQKPEMTYLQAYDQKLYAQALSKATPIALGAVETAARSSLARDCTARLAGERGLIGASVNASWLTRRMP